MKRLEEDKLKQLLEIIEDSPASRIAQFGDGDEGITKILYEFCQKNEYQYQLNSTDDDFYNRVIKLYEGKPLINITNFHLKRANYRLQGKEYEYLFVTSKIEDSDIEEFFKKSYPIIKHAGNIIIFIEKGDYEKKYRYIELLEKNNFVATNTIDDLFEDFIVIISKRMHGWGN